MRMSDWSSEVCSSDLVCTGRAGRHHRRVRSLEAVADGDLARDQVDQRRRNEEGGQAAGPALMHGDGAFVDGLEAADAGADHRSEEHTSELQSLMRISYAVFCLKKTNTHNYHK